MNSLQRIKGETILAGYCVAVQKGGLLVQITAENEASASGVMPARMARKMALAILDMTGGRDIPPQPDWEE